MKRIGIFNQLGLALFTLVSAFAFTDTTGANDLHSTNCATCQARMERARMMGTDDSGKLTRLPQGVTANRYEVTWDLNVEERRFTGEVTIQVIVSQSTDTIVMHALDLDVTRAQCWRVIAKKNAIDQPGRDDLVQLPQVKIDKKNETIALKFADKLRPGTWALKLNFKGKIAEDRMSGIYLTKYKDPDGSQKVLVTTHMEPLDARRALPCFDEPHHRATFKVKLIIPCAWKGGSNGALVSNKEIGGNKRILEFATSPSMSSYLLAFTVGELEHTETVESNGVKIRVWTTKGKSHLGKLALKAAVHSIQWYEKTLGIKYQLPNLDLVALPDFPAGAMENWGWVTFLEPYLLVDEVNGAESAKLNVVMTVTHEIAHQWFGNLVTMQSWDSLWLNEGFATLCERTCADAMVPEMKPMHDFRMYRASALMADGKASPRSIESVIDNRKKAEDVFDGMSYTKAGSLLYMLKEYVGEERFWRGVSRYLIRNSFKNAERGHLWKALDEVIKEEPNGRDEPVGSYMDEWFTRPNYPLITVTVEKGKLQVSQRPFQYKIDESTNGRVWKAPLFITAKVGGKVIERILMLTEKEATFDLGGEVESALLEPGKAFYRVAYSEGLLDLIRVKRPELTATQHFSLISDSWAVCQANGSEKAAQRHHHILRHFGQKGADKHIGTMIEGSLKQLHQMLPKADRPCLKSLRQELLP